jgi:hypothetical protein
MQGQREGARSWILATGAGTYQDGRSERHSLASTMASLHDLSADLVKLRWNSSAADVTSVGFLQALFTCNKMYAHRSVLLASSPFPTKLFRHVDVCVAHAGLHNVLREEVREPERSSTPRAFSSARV